MINSKATLDDDFAYDDDVKNTEYYYKKQKTNLKHEKVLHKD